MPAPTNNVAGFNGSLRRVDQVDYIVFVNLANIDAALRGGLLSLIEVQLMCVGGGPTLAFADAVEFLAVFERMVMKLRKLRMQ